MKILVFAHRLEVGGTQVNAIELSAMLRVRHGHDVVLFATPGPMLEYANEKRLRFIAAPDASVHPSFARGRALRQAIRQERPDVIHAWDWPQCLDAYYSTRVPTLVTDMSMVTSRFLPKALPTTFGTPELVDRARVNGRRPVLLLPPVDIHKNAPGAEDPERFKKQYGINGADFTLVTVSRLTDWMKGESLRRTIAAVSDLGKRFPLRFVVVGDGPARTDLERLARQTNQALMRHAVVLTGAMVDPRPAYAAADVVVGMGGSALRGMAFAKAVIVVGERNFAEIFNQDTAERFYYRGIYGLGDGAPGNYPLTASIELLANHPDLTSSIGAFSRDFVLKHFSLEAVTDALDGYFRNAVSASLPFHVRAKDEFRTGAILLARRLVKR